MAGLKTITVMKAEEIMIMAHLNMIRDILVMGNDLVTDPLVTMMDLLTVALA